MSRLTEVTARYLHALGIVLSYGAIAVGLMGFVMWAVWYHIEIFTVVIGVLALGGLVHMVADDLPKKG